MPDTLADCSLRSGCRCAPRYPVPVARIWTPGGFAAIFPDCIRGLCRVDDAIFIHHRSWWMGEASSTLRGRRSWGGSAAQLNFPARGLLDDRKVKADLLRVWLFMTVVTGAAAEMQLEGSREIGGIQEPYGVGDAGDRHLAVIQ